VFLNYGFRHIGSVARVMVYRRIERGNITVGYRYIESVFDLWFTDLLRVFLNYCLQTY